MKNEFIPQIKVFVTKNRKFRANIQELQGGIHYEVTIGGDSWNEGKGREYEERILKKCNGLAKAMNEELEKLQPVVTTHSCKNTRLEKHDVCDQCYSVGIVDMDCTCAYTKYIPIKLEFEVCNCCGGLIEDGNPADTPFNDEQLNIGIVIN